MEYIREVEVPEGELIVPDGNKFRSHSLTLKPRRALKELSTWIWMKENGVDFTACDNAIENGHLDVVKYIELVTKKG